MTERYKYRADDGEVVELTFAEMMERDTGGFISLPDGRAAKRMRELEPQLAACGPKRRACQSKYPIHSEAMGVNVEDIPRAQEILAKKGVKTEYDAAGRPILISSGHRKAHAEALGFYSRNGGYSDPQPYNR